MTGVQTCGLPISLGFKETAIAIFPLLFLVDVVFGRERTAPILRREWRVYLPFVITGSLYLFWVFGPKFFGWTGEAQNYYGVQSLFQSVKLGVKFVLNMLLPLSGPVEVKEIFYHPETALLVSFEVLSICGAALALVKAREWLFAIGWIVLSMAPTAVFGLYADRYLLLPFMGAALLLGFMVDGGIARFGRHKIAAQTVLLGLVCLYVVFAVPCLLNYETLWKEAAAEVRATISETRRLHPQVPEGSVFYFVNLTHSRDSAQVYLFNTSLNGALSAGGYDRSITAQRTFKSDDPREQELVRQLLACSNRTSPEAAAGPYTLVSDNGLFDVSGDCANKIVQVSRNKDPDLWK